MKRPFGLLMTGLLVIVLSGCAPAATPTAAPTAVPTAVPQPTAAPTAGVVTLKIQDAITEQADTDAVNQIVQLFEAAHPNIKIDRTSMTGADLDKIRMTIMAATDGPDIVASDPGRGHAGVMARAGLLLP